MTSKQGYGSDFKRFINKKLILRLSNDRQIIGTVKSIDHFMNMVLDDAYEFVGTEALQRKLHKTIIRGSTIIFWEFLDNSG